MHIACTQGPAFIDPDEQYPTQHHQYSLRSRIANNITQLPSNQILHTCKAVIEPVTGNVLEYWYLVKGPEKRTWIKVLSNDLGGLSQGIGKRMPSGTNTIFSIEHSDVPANRKVAYVSLVASIRPNKTETHRVRFTAGVDVLDYPGIPSIDTASRTTTKILLSIVIYTLDGMLMMADIKDFY